MSSTRPHLIPAKIGEITQGSVFSCVRLARYSGTSVLGLVITARCDIAQSKYPVLNYLPVVPLRAWLMQDGLQILLEKEQKDQVGKLKGILKQANISETILLSVGLDEIARIHFPIDTGNKSEKKRSANFHALVTEKQAFEALCESHNGKEIFNWFAQFRETEVKNIIERLSRYDLAGHYLFETLIDEDPGAAFVCLLRDVSSIPQDLAIEISNGLSQQVIKENFAPATSDLLEISPLDLAMPVACIGSPTIEHVMQTFSNLFSRIGLDDPDPKRIGALVTDCCATEGAPAI